MCPVIWLFFAENEPNSAILPTRKCHCNANWTLFSSSFVVFINDLHKTLQFYLHKIHDIAIRLLLRWHAKYWNKLTHSQSQQFHTLYYSSPLSSHFLLQGCHIFPKPTIRKKVAQRRPIFIFFSFTIISPSQRQSQGLDHQAGQWLNCLKAKAWDKAMT